jgi:ferredoxin
VVTQVALDRCTGCRACELVCSFRATGTFWPQASAIQVAQLYQDPGVRFDLTVDPESCDLCAGEPVPRCLEACPRSVLSRAGIREMRGGAQ